MGEVHEIRSVARFRQAPLIGRFGFGALELPSQGLDSLNLLRLETAHFQLGANDAKIVDDRIAPDQVDVGGYRCGPIRIRRHHLA